MVSATEALKAASAARVRAERRHAQLADELGALDRELASKFAAAADLAAELESARQQMRHSAIDAFISSGGEDLSIQALAGDDAAEISARRTFSATRSLDWADAVAGFQELKQDNDPELVAMTERREALAAKVADAVDAVFQSTAVEADAERASVEAAAAAVREREAAQAAASASQRSSPTTAPRSGTPAPAGTGATPASAVPSTTAAPRAVVLLTEPSAPLPDLPEGGPSDAAWSELRRCESGGNYQAVSGSGRYRGAYQFDQQTWEAMGGRGDPAGALPVEQDARARALYFQRGARAWPQCGRALI